MTEGEETLKSKTIKELSQKIPEELVIDLISSYEGALAEYRKGRWKETLGEAGKFAENTFRILEFLLTSKIKKESPNFKEVRDKLEKIPSNMLPESIRILIPRIASSMIYDLRSKRAVVHVKEINPDYMDATLVLSACNWILAEFVRTYHTSDSHKIVNIITELVQRKMPFVEMHAGKMLITKQIGCQDEVLLILLNFPAGLSRREIGEILGRYYARSTITQALHKLEEKRYIGKVNGKYVISGPGEERISRTLSKLEIG